MNKKPTFKQFLEKLSNKAISNLRMCGKIPEYCHDKDKLKFGQWNYFKEVPEKIRLKLIDNYGFNFQNITETQKAIIEKIHAFRLKEEEKKKKEKCLRYCKDNIERIKEFLGGAKFYIYVWSGSYRHYKISTTKDYTIFQNLDNCFKFKIKKDNDSPRKGQEHEYYQFCDTKQKAKRIIEKLESLQ